MIAISNPEELKKFVNKLWQTSIFKEAKYVADWVERFVYGASGNNPRKGWVFAEMSEPELEYAHFGTWFGITYLRHYDNKVVNDLYYLHEIVHAVLVEYNSTDAFTSWFRRVNTTEFAASLETEAYIYLEMPELRDISFDDRIWADRWLGSRLDKEETKKLMRQERYRAIREPDPMDYCEQQISAYARQNFEWANIWKLNASVYMMEKDWAEPKWPSLPAFKHVENHMAAFLSGEMDIDDHVHWLQSMGDVPFPDQARLFSDVYWRNKLGYRKE